LCPFEFDENRHGETAQRPLVVRTADDQRGLRRAEHPVQLVVVQARVDRHRDRAEVHGGEGRQDEIRPVVQHDRHPVTGLHARADQPPATRAAPAYTSMWVSTAPSTS
jgi:hypothetical protein